MAKSHVNHRQLQGVRQATWGLHTCFDIHTLFADGFKVAIAIDNENDTNKTAMCHQQNTKFDVMRMKFTSI